MVIDPCSFRTLFRFAQGQILESVRALIFSSGQEGTGLLKHVNSLLLNLAQHDH